MNATKEAVGGVLGDIDLIKIFEDTSQSSAERKRE